MALLTTQTFNELGATITFAAATVSGDTISNTGNRQAFILVKNDGGSSIDVTIPAVPSTVRQTQYGTLDVPDIVKSVAAGAVAIIAFPPTDTYADSYVTDITYSDVTSVSVAAVQYTF